MKNQEFIERVIKGEKINSREMVNFTTWEETQPFIIEVGKNARNIAERNNGSFFAKKMMGEVEKAYFKALHADCGYTMHIAAQDAIGWLAQMVSMFGIN